MLIFMMKIGILHKEPSSMPKSTGLYLTCSYADFGKEGRHKGEKVLREGEKRGGQPKGQKGKRTRENSQLPGCHEKDFFTLKTLLPPLIRSL